MRNWPARLLRQEEAGAPERAPRPRERRGKGSSFTHGVRHACSGRTAGKKAAMRPGLSKGRDRGEEFRLNPRDSGSRK